MGKYKAVKAPLGSAVNNIYSVMAALLLLRRPERVASWANPHHSKRIYSFKNMDYSLTMKGPVPEKQDGKLLFMLVLLLKQLLHKNRHKNLGTKGYLYPP